MGFDTRNSNTSKPVNYVSIYSEKDEKLETKAKFFKCTKKVNGAYETEILKNQSGYPIPFFGYLRGIEFKLDNKIKKTDGKEIPAPKVAFSFIDDKEEIYVLDLPFLAQTGRVSSNVMTFINSLASIKEFGYLKVYITSTEKEGVKNYTLNVRNNTEWNPNQRNFQSFLTPKDSSVVDTTKVSWKYKYDEIPTLTKKIEIEGEIQEVNNTKKHQQFFIDIVNNEIIPTVKNASYVFETSSPVRTTTVAASGPVVQSTEPSFDEDDTELSWNVADAPKSNSEVSFDDDLPF